MSEEEQKRSEPELREQQIAVPQTSNLDIFIDDLLIFSKKRNKFIIFSIAIISVLTLLIYSNIYDNSRHFDDDFIFLNNDVHNPSDVMKVFQINPFRFITFYSFSLNYAFSGDKLFSYYLINVLIHIVNSILIFLIAVSIFETPKLANTNFARYKMLYSLAIALIFATHPLQTQSVTYIYQRLNSLGAFFYFTSVFLYIRFRLSDKKFLRKSWILLLSLVAVLFGLFSKENTFTLPFVFVLLEITLLNKKFTVNIIYIFLALVIVAFGVALFFLFQIPERVFYPTPNFNGEIVNSLNYFTTQFKVFPKYFLLLLFPFKQNIDHNVTISNSFNETDVIIGMLFVAASIIIATISYRKNKLSFFGVFWIYGTLAVESSFIPVADVMNEHRLYIPMFGFALILIDLLHTILKDEKRLKSVVIFLLLLISFYSIKTLVRNNDWNTEYSLWSDAATKSPNKARAQFKKGVAALEQGLIPVAMESFQKTIALYPKFPSVYSYLGAIYFYSANYPLSIINYTTFIQLSHPRNKPDGIISRARAFTKMNMMDSAKKDYNLYLSLRPKDSIALREVSAFYNSLGQKDSISAIYALVANRDKGNFGATFQLAMEYLNKKDYNKALTYLNMLVDNESLDNVKKSEIYNLRAATYFYQNNMVDAAIDYENAVALNPKYIEGWRNKAMLHRNLKEYELEMESINKLDGLLPGEPQVAFLKGRNLYKQGKIKEAKPYLLRFLKSQPNHQETKDILNKIK